MNGARWKVLAVMAPIHEYRVLVRYDGEEEPRVYAFRRRRFESMRHFWDRVTASLEAGVNA